MPGASFRHRQRRNADKFAPSYKNCSDIVDSARSVRRIDESARSCFRISVVALDQRKDFLRVQLIAQTIAAQQKCGVGLKQKLLDLNEVFFMCRAAMRADIAKHLMPTRMRHGVALGQLAT